MIKTFIFLKRGHPQRKGGVFCMPAPSTPTQRSASINKRRRKRWQKKPHVLTHSGHRWSLCSPNPFGSFFFCEAASDIPWRFRQLSRKYKIPCYMNIVIKINPRLFPHYTCLLPLFSWVRSIMCYPLKEYVNSDTGFDRKAMRAALVGVIKGKHQRALLRVCRFYLTHQRLIFLSLAWGMKTNKQKKPKPVSFKSITDMHADTLFHP